TPPNGPISCSPPKAKPAPHPTLPQGEGRVGDSDGVFAAHFVALKDSPVHTRITECHAQEIGCFRFRWLNGCRSRPRPTSVESGASCSHSPIQLKEGVPQHKIPGYWISRFRACEEIPSETGTIRNRNMHKPESHREPLFYFFTRSLAGDDTQTE